MPFVCKVNSAAASNVRSFRLESQYIRVAFDIHQHFPYFNNVAFHTGEKGFTAVSHTSSQRDTSLMK